MNLPPSPFKGLAAFGEGEYDRLLFFGRERESEVVAANLMASRLTVLYGPSGVGKTSLLRAGVARRLRVAVPAAAADGGSAEVAVVDSWRDDPILAVAAAAGAPTDVPLVDALAERAITSGVELYLILDQMEEYVLYHGRDGGPLAGALEDVLTRADLPVHVLLGVRDDALADLDALKRRLPGLFGNVLRLDHLTRAAARTAIEGPLRAYAELGGPEVAAEPELVEAVLDEVAAGRIEQHLTGRGVVDETVRERRVEAPFLQLVLERLWEVERERGSDTLHAATLAELGGAERIVEAHLERALAGMDATERDLAARVFDYLVTPSGTKIAHAVDDLARYADAPADRLARVLGALDASRILRRVPARAGGPPRYEIFHDVLAPAVLAWRDRHESEQALERERAESQRRHRRLLALAIGALVGLAGALALTVWALEQREEARDQRAAARNQARTAQSRQLAAVALTQLDTDPELSVVLAAEAARLEQTPRIEATLVRALVASRVRARMSVADPVESVDVVAGRIVAPVHGGAVVTKPALREYERWNLDGEVLGRHGGLLLVSSAAGLELRSPEDGRLVKRLPLRPGASVLIRDVNSGDVVGSVDLPERFEVAAVGPRGTMVAVSDGTRRIVVANALNGEARYVLEQASSVTTLAFGPGARILASGGKDGTARLWRVATGSQFAPLRGHNSWVTDVAFSPRATYVATASRDGTGRVWAIGKAEPVSVLANHTNPIFDISFSPDGNLIVTASSDRTARVWKADTGAQQSVLAGHTETVTGATFLSNTQVVTASADSTLRRWYVVNAPELRPVIAGLPPIARATIVGSQRFEIVTTDGRRRLVDLEGTLLEEGTADPTPPIRSILGTTAEIEGSAVILHPAGEDEIRLEGHTLPVTSVRFSTDGERVVTASRDTDARIWNARTGALLRTLRGHFSIVSDASFSPDGRWVVTAGPQTAGLWDASSGARIFFLYGHDDILTSASFDRSGRTIVTGSRDGEVRYYVCDICVGGVGLLRTAERRLRLTGREFTAADRATYLGG
jgi:WD40 repeat protein